MGTQFGEARPSSVTEVPFERQSALPVAVLSLRYDDRTGLLALGIPVGSDSQGRGCDLRLRESADPFRRDPGFAEPPQGWHGG